MATQKKKYTFKIIPQPITLKDYKKVCEIVGIIRKLGFTTHIKVTEVKT